MKAQKYVVCFALMREEEVEALDEIAAFQEAMAKLKPRERDAVLRYRIYDEEGTLVHDWVNYDPADDEGGTL